LITCRDVARHDHLQGVDPTTISANHSKLDTLDERRLAATRHVTKLLHDEPGHGIELPIRPLETEELVELLDRRGSSHQVLTIGFLADVLIFFDVELVVDVANDLLYGILDSDETGNAALLIHDDSHMISVSAKFFEKDINPLGFRNDHDRPHALTHVEIHFIAAREHPQYILCEQYPNDVVAIVVNDGITRVTGLHDDGQQSLRRFISPHGHHLRARHHDVSHLQICYLEHALQHLQGIGVDETALQRLPQLHVQIGQILSLARKRFSNAAYPSEHTGFGGCHRSSSNS
jgi:hypothetical protein